MFSKLKSQLACGVLAVTGSFASASEAQWIYEGKTGGDCKVSASLYVLSGYPFAKLIIHEGSSSTTYPLAVIEGHDCEVALFEKVPRKPMQLPTVMVEAKDLCRGSLPTYQIIKSYSGVQFKCDFVQ